MLVFADLSHVCRCSEGRPAQVPKNLLQNIVNCSFLCCVVSKVIGLCLMFRPIFAVAVEAVLAISCRYLVVFSATGLAIVHDDRDINALYIPGHGLIPDAS